MTQKIATLLVVLLFATYIVALRALPEYPLLHWLVAFSEAALVGALADWFAVVALFRRPLGIPFPHAAVLPRSKKRIGQALGKFLADNFLARAPLEQYLRAHQPLQALLGWLNHDANRTRVSQSVTRVAPQALKLLRTLVAGPLGASILERGIRRALRSGSLEQMVAGISQLPEQPAFTTECLKACAAILEHHEDWIHDIVSRELPWWVPSFVHTTIYRTTLHRLMDKLRAMANNPHHPDRKIIFALLRNGLAEMGRSPETPELLGRAASSFLTADAVRALLLRALTELEHQAPFYIPTLSDELLKEIPKAISADPALEAQLSEILTEVIIELGAILRPESINFIATTLESWDDTFLSEKLEQEIGPDLQFIRINGTFVGGVIGLVLEYCKSAW